MSEKKIVDCTGMSCPQPVLMTRDALTATSAGVIEIFVDNEASRDNVARFGKSQGCEVAIVEENGKYRLTLIKTATSQAQADAPAAEEYVCNPGAGLVYVFGSNTMGEGEEELGTLLMRAFIKTMKEISPLPAKLLFYNSGVFLTAKESDIIEPLRLLEEQGVEILSCGTCLDYYHLQDNLLIGKSTNMFEIMNSMVTAQKVVSPL